MTYIKKHIFTIAGIAIGALGGFLYWKYVGCDSGSCAITSKPLNSTLYGAFMGGLLFSSFQKEKQRKVSTNNLD